ncbi:MAG: YHS domain-containing protein [Armatimonadetes bacterium]|nr:YHS domain-containing protein [Armatimonadota bacterium]
MDTIKVHRFDPRKAGPSLPAPGELAARQLKMAWMGRAILVGILLFTSLGSIAVYRLFVGAPSAPQAVAQAPAVSSTSLVVDPVCGKPVDAAQSRWSVEVAGKVVCFDSEMCMKAYQIDPVRYAQVRVRLNVSPTPDQGGPLDTAPTPEQIIMPTPDSAPPPADAPEPISDESLNPVHTNPSDAPPMPSEPAPPLEPLSGPGIALPTPGQPMPSEAPPAPPATEGPTVESDAPSIEEKPPFEAPSVPSKSVPKGFKK